MQITLYGSIGWRHPMGMGQVIQWARRWGWGAVDARGLSLGIPGDVGRQVNAFGYDMLGPRQIRPSARDELRQQLMDAETPLLGIYCSSPVNLTGQLGEQCRQLFCEYIDLAADLDAPWVRTINNSTHAYQGPDMSDEEAYLRTVKGLREVASHAHKRGVGLLLENNENEVAHDVRSLVNLKQDLDGACDVGITYDPVNAYFQGLDPYRGFDLLNNQLDVLHVKNVCRHETDRWDYMPRGDYSYEWTTLAHGDLDWSKLLRMAREAGFTGPIVYEYVNPFKGMPPRYWDRLPEPDVAARTEAEFLHQVISELEQ